MFKRSIAVIVTALVLGVAGGAIAESASATVIAKEGHYSGHDHNGNHIGFSYSRSHGMNHFTIGYHFTIGGAHVNNAMWHETCHNGYCTTGSWGSSTAVHGHYRHGGSSHKVAYTVHWVRGLH